MQGSDIQPVVYFQNEAAVFGPPEFDGIVVGVDDVNIRHGLIPPLKTAVDIKIVCLGIVLQEGSPEQIF